MKYNVKVLLVFIWAIPLLHHLPIKKANNPELFARSRYHQAKLGVLLSAVQSYIEVIWSQQCSCSYTRNLQALSKLFLSRVCTTTTSSGGVVCVSVWGWDFQNQVLSKSTVDPAAEKQEYAQDHSKSFYRRAFNALLDWGPVQKLEQRKERARDRFGQCCCDCQPSWPIFWRAGLRWNFGTVLYLRLQPSKIVIFNLGVGV